MSAEPPGPLEFVAPVCPRCNYCVTHDGDLFVCERCHCRWPDPHGHAEFTDEHGELDPDGFMERHRQHQEASTPQQSGNGQ